ncbi:hypothetical protein KFU94_01855, partial [Chloroflexi bacterium TSY]|nr:hypothetical protein [Chloroflexi bacterium TSY]
ITARQSGVPRGAQYHWQEPVSTSTGMIRYFVEVIELSGENRMLEVGTVSLSSKLNKIFLPFVMK